MASRARQARRTSANEVDVVRACAQAAVEAWIGQARVRGGRLSIAASAGNALREQIELSRWCKSNQMGILCVLGLGVGMGFFEYLGMGFGCGYGIF